AHPEYAGERRSYRVAMLWRRLTRSEPAHTGVTFALVLGLLLGVLVTKLADSHDNGRQVVAGSSATAGNEPGAGATTEAVPGTGGEGGTTGSAAGPAGATGAATAGS